MTFQTSPTGIAGLLSRSSPVLSTWGSLKTLGVLFSRTWVTQESSEGIHPVRDSESDTMMCFIGNLNKFAPKNLILDRYKDPKTRVTTPFGAGQQALQRLRALKF